MKPAFLVSLELSTDGRHYSPAPTTEMPNFITVPSFTFNYFSDKVSLYTSRLAETHDSVVIVISSGLYFTGLELQKTAHSTLRIALLHFRLF